MISNGYMCLTRGTRTALGVGVRTSTASQIEIDVVLDDSDVYETLRPTWPAFSELEARLRIRALDLSPDESGERETLDAIVDLRDVECLEEELEREDEVDDDDIATQVMLRESGPRRIARAAPRSRRRRAPVAFGAEPHPADDCPACGTHRRARAQTGTRSTAQRRARLAVGLCALVAGLAGGLAWAVSPAGRSTDVPAALSTAWTSALSAAGDGPVAAPRLR
jgi:hypothetical protein